MTFDERVKRVLADLTWQVIQLQQTLDEVSKELIDCKAKRGDEYGSNA